MQILSRLMQTVIVQPVPVVSLESETCALRVSRWQPKVQFTLLTLRNSKHALVMGTAADVIVHIVCPKLVSILKAYLCQTKFPVRIVKRTKPRFQVIRCDLFDGVQKILVITIRNVIQTQKPVRCTCLDSALIVYCLLSGCH